MAKPQTLLGLVIFVGVQSIKLMARGHKAVGRLLFVFALVLGLLMLLGVIREG